MRYLPLPEEASSIIEAVKKLREKYPSFSFMPDGHLPGHIGVAIADRYFRFKEIKPESTPSCDAIDADDHRVEIKTTGRKSFAFRKLSGNTKPPNRVIAIRLLWDEGKAELIYDGPYKPVGDLIAGKINNRIKKGLSGWPNNGQHQITLKQMTELKENT